MRANFTRACCAIAAIALMSTCKGGRETVAVPVLTTPSAALTALPARPLLFTTDKDCSKWDYAEEWTALGYSTTCLGNIDIRNLVVSHCRDRPRKIIQYADIARLLILYEQGGWYVDSDVRPTRRCQAVTSFPETTFGLESDFATVDEANRYGMLQQSLSLWAIYGKKGDARLLENAKKLCALSTRTARPRESRQKYIFSTSGPTIQTQLWNGTVLPVSVFGCGQQHSNSPPCHAESCWGCHGFKGRWL